MKIKLLCDDSSRLEQIRQSMLAMDNALEVIGSVGSPENLPTFINGSTPDAVVVDGASPRVLEVIEALALRRPGFNAIVISQDSTPEFLLKAMRAGVREVVPMASPPDVLQAALARVKQMRGVTASACECKVYAFLSCKGGSGATFLATNLAYAMAATQGKRVALIDLNLQFGDARYVSDQRGRATLPRKRRFTGLKVVAALGHAAGPAELLGARRAGRSGPRDRRQSQ
jgi:pilus assembly protein CpaE